MASPTAASLTLFRAALFQFEPVESGGAALFRYAPLGTTRPLLFRVAEVLGIEKPEDDEALRGAAEAYVRFLDDLPEIVRRIALAPGQYEVPSIGAAFRRIAEGRDPSKADDMVEVERLATAAYESSFRDDIEAVEVTETLLAMVRASCYRPEWDYQRFGWERVEAKAAEVLLDIHRSWLEVPAGRTLSVPIQAVDGKRPYGDRTYYYWDLEDLGVPGIAADGEIIEGRRGFSDERQQEIDALQAATPLVFQALAVHGGWPAR